MRLLLVGLLLLLSVLPAFAHDNLWGFMKCYGDGLHCEQDTLVFALVTAEDKDTHTLTIEKVLRQNAPLAAGTQVRIKKTGYEDVFNTGKAPKVGGAIVVSFLREGRRQPYQPRNLACSTTRDWRRMTIDSPRYYGDMVAFEHFVRSGGEDDDYYFYKNETYLRKSDGQSELIYKSAPQGDAPAASEISHYKSQPKYLNALERRARQRHLNVNVPLVMSFFLPAMVFFAFDIFLAIVFVIAASRKKKTLPPTVRESDK
jgi:hypothetical protein